MTVIIFSIELTVVYKMTKSTSELSNNTACEPQRCVGIGKPFGIYVSLLKISRILLALTVLHCLIQNILNLLKMFRLFT